MNMREKINITFLFNGTKQEVEAEVGSNLLEIAEKNNTQLKGACEGNGACGTCHVIFDDEGFSKLKDMDEQEEDTLDMVPGLTHCSRLACKIKLTKEMDGLTIEIWFRRKYANKKTNFFTFKFTTIVSCSSRNLLLVLVIKCRRSSKVH